MGSSRSKKRKVSAFFQSQCASEQERNLATNTLREKVDPNGSISSSKRRLVLSKHLMQQLLKPAPKLCFSDNNTARNYELAVYFVSRISLTDACSLKRHLDMDTISTYPQTSKMDSDQPDSSHVKHIVEKIHKLQSDFLSLERTASMLDIMLEIQDLERFSVINHLAKFHNRAKTTTSRPVPQMHIVDIHMPMNLPKLLHCFHL